MTASTGTPNMSNSEAQLSNINKTKICCVGAGYVGGPTMAMIAKKCPHIEVYVLDISEERIAAWNSDRLPIYEPGLSEIVHAQRGRNLFFTTNVEKSISECDIIFVSVNTPTKKTGVGAGRACNLSSWEKAGRSIAKYSKTAKIIVEKSTVPVRTAAALHRVLQANTSGASFTILSNPEFLAEGTAMTDLEDPDRILIGGPETPTGKAALEIVADVYRNWVPAERVLTTGLWSAELSKLVANAFLAQRVSSINAISQLCDVTGADVDEVSRSIGMDSRIGPKFLKSSVGFGGSCFQKDILNLVYICESFGLSDVANYWQQVVTMNNLQKAHFTNKILHAMFNTVSGKKIAVFGFAFKKDTGDTRETPAVTVCDILMEEGARLFCYDPQVTRTQALREFDDHGIQRDFGSCFITAASPEEAISEAHAVVILTEWDEFKKYDYAQFYERMQKPAFCFDGRNILDHDKLRKIGFEMHAIGKGTAVTSHKDWTNAAFDMSEPVDQMPLPSGSMDAIRRRSFGGH